MTMPSANQLSGSKFVIRQALLMTLVGLVFGMFIPQAPFPRLALVGHIEAVTNGPMWLGVGAVIHSDFMSVSDTGLLILRVGVLSNWASITTECLNGWWGTTFLSIVSVLFSLHLYLLAIFEHRDDWCWTMERSR
jgi:hydroxylaminobenzene mutase